MSETVRKSINTLFQNAVSERGLECVQGHMKPKNIADGGIVDLARGYWSNSSDNSKPRRWIFWCDDQCKISQPDVTQADVIGAVSATSAEKRKALLTFRCLVLPRSSGGNFLIDPTWEWVLWFALKSILPASVGNSAVVRKLRIGDGKVTIHGKDYDLSGAGLVGLQAADQMHPVLANLSYGAIGKALQEFLIANDAMKETDEVSVSEATPQAQVAENIQAKAN